MSALTDLQNRCEDVIRDRNRVVVAVSGGLDSVVMLHVLHSAGYKGVVAHVNYGFRGAESDGDEAFVRRLGEALGWPVRVAHPEIPAGNRQDVARTLRYGFFEQVRNDVNGSDIVLAQHEDDQVETIILKVLRGARADACHGMRRRKGYLVRPWLDVPRAALESYAARHGLTWRDDSSNQDVSYMRNHIRHQLLPFMDRNKILDMGRESERLGEDLDVILSAHTSDKNIQRSLLAIPDRDVAELAVFRFARRWKVRLSDAECESLFKHDSFQTGQKIGPFFRERDGWRLASEPKSGVVSREWFPGAIGVSSNIGTAFHIRQWSAGDRLDGKKLSDLMTNAKWPASERAVAQVLVMGDGLIAAVVSESNGIVSAEFRADESEPDVVYFGIE
jgi:tRNA(Ile)-lysidine synthetase-like protein